MGLGYFTKLKKNGRDGDLPAVIKKHGKHEEFWKDGTKVKSVIDGIETWYKDDKIHRDGDLPAIILSGGSQFWCRYGKIHRRNLPAVIYPNGLQEWYINGNMTKADERCIIM